MSLRLRLTLTYTALVALILALFGTILYGTLRRTLEQETDKRLHIRASQVELTIFPGPNSAVSTVIISSKLDLSPLDELNAPSVYVQVLDKNGNVVATSSNLNDTSLPTTGVGLAAGLAGKERLETVNVGRGQKVRVLSQPIVSQGQVAGILQVGQSRQPLLQTLADLRALLLILGVLALLLCGGIGWLVARNGLRPIQAMARRAAELTSGRDFGQRLGVAWSRTEVGQLARTIDELLATVDELLRQHRQFVADTSHELRNPLLAIRTNLELLPRVREGADQVECLDEARAQVDRMSRLVDDLLLLARAESSQFVDLHPVALSSLVRRVGENARLQANGQQIALGPIEDLTVLGDEGRLEQVLVNLMTNALQHTPTGGQVMITLGQIDGWARLTVHDSGEGIAPDDLPHIFERFYQARTPGRPFWRGTGLGLSIVDHLVRAHHGRVEVQSTLGAGSCFTIWLPTIALAVPA
ncbi:MAG: ATP-binding protein [Dehalococcoidia bacterium]